MSRAANAIFAVVVAVVVSMRFGQSNLGKLVTVLITAAVVAVCEGLVVWAPKHSSRARRLLDPRSIFAGVWIQDVVHVHGYEDAPTAKNRFAVFSLAYRQSTDDYAVEGTAYDEDGKEHARWQSVETAHFTKDGRSITYLWEGTITDRTLGPGDPRRTGFARLLLSSDDGGRGRVEHIALDGILEFNVRRVTPRLLAEYDLAHFKPSELRDPGLRDKFGAAFASRLKQLAPV
jgi:hypothetical protein